ncbi:similar to Saccharomyces cerevisiae ZIM17 Heat shock protein with a zinc finger motif [Maudiozyma saulgeensis]|uniref:Similar to Saccharomyces cerevisiae ZIM17 Heat shock protein with a zinc finger motif n=1 Tax=Maudiozyma saulgeensis TaxID=1789683 RepID=A0A1X7R1E2_9SACH|nr:similar to Saccharomyces cerevisiae ZIM17 Heat shock protein with a zinc finger motif [Kazachstania saulgeensis]
MYRLGRNGIVRSVARQYQLRSMLVDKYRMMVPLINRLLPFIDLRTRGFHSSLYSRQSDNHGSNNDDTHHIGSFKVEKPQYMLAFTCKKCNHRSSHTISKQAYHHGTVMVKCPKCNNRHLIADHLKIFNDNHITIEDIMKAKGETVSQSTDDLIFDDIPDSLKNLIGHYAKDAPNDLKQKKLDNTKINHLPPPSSESSSNDNTK